MKNLREIVELYTNQNKNSPYHNKNIVSVSARINLEAKIKLQAISNLFGKRPTPLLAELIEASINEIFDQVELTDELRKEFESKMREAGLKNKK
jgi:predicted DNA-binding protein